MERGVSHCNLAVARQGTAPRNLQSAGPGKTKTETKTETKIKIKIKTKTKADVPLR